LIVVIALISEVKPFSRKQVGDGFLALSGKPKFSQVRGRKDTRQVDASALTEIVQNFVMHSTAVERMKHPVERCSIHEPFFVGSTATVRRKSDMVKLASEDAGLM
jgi:hypothetical protein